MLRSVIGRGGAEVLDEAWFPIVAAGPLTTGVGPRHQRDDRSAASREITIVQKVPPLSVEQDDHALIVATAAGDALAFRALVDRHHVVLYRLAYRMLHDAAEAEDVVQDAFVRLWDHAASWQPRGGGAPAWLRRIATNLCLDRLRRRARVADVAPPDVIDDTPGADRRLDGDRLDRIVRAAIMALRDHQRAAIVLTYYEDLSNAEAAEMLGMKIKAFESLLLRARQALRARFRAAGISTSDLGEQA